MIGKEWLTMPDLVSNRKSKTRFVRNMGSQEQITREVIESFNAAFNRQDVRGMETLLTDDTVFEDTSPPPDGLRVAGRDAVIEFWRRWFKINSGARFETEEMILSGNRAVVRWIYFKTREDRPWHLRGIDVFTVRNGKIAAKLAYVKG